MKKETKADAGKPITSLNHNQRISKRLEELEETAKRNRDKYHDHPLTDWLDNDEQDEYNRLIQEWNNIKVGK